MKINRLINIKGEVCPYALVKAKMALEQIKSKQTLAVVTDFKAAAKNIAIVLEAEGHKILKKMEVNKTDYKLIIEKK